MSEKAYCCDCNREVDLKDFDLDEDMCVVCADKRQTLELYRRPHGNPYGCPYGDY